MSRMAEKMAKISEGGKKRERKRVRGRQADREMEEEEKKS